MVANIDPLAALDWKGLLVRWKGLWSYISENLYMMVQMNKARLPIKGLCKKVQKYSIECLFAEIIFILKSFFNLGKLLDCKSNFNAS